MTGPLRAGIDIGGTKTLGVVLDGAGEVLASVRVPSGFGAVAVVQSAERVLAELPKLSVDMTTNWNHRYRENMERIKSGDLLEVAGVIKALMHRDGERGAGHHLPHVWCVGWVDMLIVLRWL